MSPDDEDRGSRLLPLLRKAKDRAVERLADPGVAASDFRAEPIAWSPPTVGFFGQVDLPHRLGRMPRGLLLLQEAIGLSWVVDADQKARWTADRVSFFALRHHFLDSCRTTIANGTAEATYSLLKTRPSGCNLCTALAMQDNAASDRPPVKVIDYPTANGRVTGVRFMMANHVALAGFSIVVNAHVRTELAPEDEFSFLVV